MVKIYKDGEEKKVHEIDAPSWISVGWSYQKGSGEISTPTPIEKVKRKKKVETVNESNDPVRSE